MFGRHEDHSSHNMDVNFGLVWNPMRNIESKMNIFHAIVSSYLQSLSFDQRLSTPFFLLFFVTCRWLRSLLFQTDNSNLMNGKAADDIKLRSHCQLKSIIVTCFVARCYFGINFSLARFLGLKSRTLVYSCTIIQLNDSAQEWCLHMIQVLAASQPKIEFRENETRDMENGEWRC